MSNSPLRVSYTNLNFSFYNSLYFRTNLGIKELIINTKTEDVRKHNSMKEDTTVLFNKALISLPTLKKKTTSQEADMIDLDHLLINQSVKNNIDPDLQLKMPEQKWPKKEIRCVQTRWDMKKPDLEKEMQQETIQTIDQLQGTECLLHALLPDLLPFQLIKNYLLVNYKVKLLHLSQDKEI